MPFTKIKSGKDKGKYKSPSGRVFTGKQVKLYYAHDGFPKKKWKRVVDNKMHGHGDIDYEKKVIRVNKSKKKNKRKGEVLNTIIHEELHRKHPKMHEKTVYKKAKEMEKKTSVKQARKIYSRFK
ncbi:MAG: hypothetical protein V1678_03960 [Candidatus Aenigmatarchaeota archaeon]